MGNTQVKWSSESSELSDAADLKHCLEQPMKLLYGIIHVCPLITNSTMCRLVSFQWDSGFSLWGSTMAKRTCISDDQRYFRACFSKEGWLEWIHVQGDGFKSVNKHWFDEGTSGGKLNHFFNLSCCFIPGCASFYLNNSTNQTKLAIRIDCSCIYKSIIA